MSTKKIALYTALFALAAGMLFTCYRGVQLYHEVARPPVLVANAAAPAVQPGKQDGGVRSSDLPLVTANSVW